jgi:RNA polymerase sigma-70 factor (ECF subfamily)
MPAPVTLDFEGVYRAELSYVMHTLRRLGVAHTDLEDVAHDVFVAVHRHFDDYDAGRPLRPWLFAFAYRIARDHRKLARHRLEVHEPVDEPAGEMPLPDEALDDERLRRMLLAVLDALDFEKRSIIVMHDIDGMPVPEIAKLLEVPLNTAYSRLRLARAAFERELERLRRTP